MGREKPLKKKKNRKILFQTGIVIIVLFALMTMAISNITILTGFSSTLTSMRLENAVHLQEVNDWMEFISSFPWLMTYWNEHAEDLSVKEENRESDTERMLAVLKGLGEGYFEGVTPQQADSLSEKEQEAFALGAYWDVAEYIRYVANQYNMNELTVLKPDEETGEALIIFDYDSSQEDMLSLGDRISMKDLENAWNRFDSAMYGDNHWAVRLPSRDTVFGFYRKFPHKKTGEYLICNTITGAQVYDSMFFVDSIQNRVTVFLIVIGLLILIFLYMIVLRPLSVLEQCVRDYQVKKDTAATVKALSRVSARNEIGVFSDEFASLVKEMERYTAEVAKLAGERERAATELNVAARIQADMLPGKYPPRPEFEMSAAMFPAREVGGDFYDFFLIDEDHLALVIADVSGKGVPAALFMAVTRTIIKNRALMGGTPAEVLYDANNQICEGNETGMFVTAWLGILELSTGRLLCCNAGHEYPVLRLGDEPFKLHRTRHDLALGALEDMPYNNETWQLSPGDCVFVYTDGVPEATRADETMFTCEELERVLEKAGGEVSPGQILGSVKAAVDAFVGKAPQFDDLTMLCLLYKGKPEAGTK